MIEYKKAFGAFNLLFRVYGAPWPRAIVLALPSTILSVIIKKYFEVYAKRTFLHPYPYSLFGGILAFLLIFRSNLSYTRYWEACTMLAQMSSKWCDAAIQVITFDEAAKEPAIPGGTQFRAEFVHTMSLMHALAMRSLRGESDFMSLTNLDFFDTIQPPAVDAGKNVEWKKERGIWSNFSLSSKCNEYLKHVPLPVIGGLNKTEKNIISMTDNPVYMTFCWVHRELVARRMAGGIKEDAPIVSRIYQVLSDGMLGYENAKKICKTPFPFPYAQSVTFLLHINAVGAPLLMANWIGKIWLVAICTFFSVFSFYLINEVAREIEEPFRYEPNDLPLYQFHHNFNNKLIIAFIYSQFPSGGLFSQINDRIIKERMEKVRPASFVRSGSDFFEPSEASKWNSNLGGASPISTRQNSHATFFIEE